MTHHATSTEVNDWSVRIRVDRNALGGNFAIGIFVLSPSEIDESDSGVSKIPSKPSQWGDSNAFVGQVSVTPTALSGIFSTGFSGQSETTPRPIESMMQGFVNLEDILADRLGQKTDAPTVVPYLQKALHWKASQPSSVLQEGQDAETNLNQIPSLEVTVLRARLRSVKHQLPVYDDPIEHPEITRGKAGGSKTSSD